MQRPCPGQVRDLEECELSRVETGLNFRRWNFRLFVELLDKISWETMFRDKGGQQSWLLF